jgi:D-beta-D-heptose 7-phosphate kinase / D-beta-D-heptose 1-phosphate adenosyltransferase
VQAAADRAAVLRSLGCVDEVVIFHDDTPVAALQRHRPDIFVKGGDYAVAAMAETEVLATWGGIVVTLPYVDGRSTTSILDRVGASASAFEATAEPSGTGGAR